MYQAQEYPERLTTGSPDVINAAMFRQVLMDLCITPERFNNLIDKYLARSSLNVAPRELSSIRGKTLAELMEDRISWKVFIKGLALINVRKVDIEICLQFRDEIIVKNRLPESKLVLANTILIPNDFLAERKGEEHKHLGTYLAEMFQMALKALDVDKTIFDQLMNRYIEVARVPIEGRKLSNIKGGINKELTNNFMTWTVFVKAMLFLGVRSFRYSVALTHITGVTTLHQKNVSIYSE